MGQRTNYCNSKKPVPEKNHLLLNGHVSYWCLWAALKGLAFCFGMEVAGIVFHKLSVFEWAIKGCCCMSGIPQFFHAPFR
jgi:hypothetical protein